MTQRGEGPTHSDVLTYGGTLAGGEDEADQVAGSVGFIVDSQSRRPPEG